MPKVINLRTARKQASRSAKRTRGEENAALHGETKAGRKLREATSTKTEKQLDQHKREP